MAIKDEYKNISAMVKDMESQIQMFDGVLDLTISMKYQLDLSIKPFIAELSNEDIDNLTEEKVESIFKACSDANNLKEDMMVSFKETQVDSDDYSDKPFIDYAKHAFKDMHDTITDIDEITAEKNKLDDDLEQIKSNWFDYINSQEYKDKRRARIEDLKSRVDAETDNYKKRQTLEMIESMEKSENLSFLFDRIDEYGEKEIKNIMNIYFDKHRSSLVIDKFSSKLPRYGYNKDIYKMFFNIEENFLTEEYYDLNNIFLFHVMRFISYTDTSSKKDTLYVSSLLMKLYNLVYHKYEKQEMEDEFLNVVKKFDNYFMQYIETFKEDNVTSPNHPIRKQRDIEFEEKRRMMVIASLQNEGVDVDTTLETDELRAMLQDIIDKKSNPSPETEETESVTEDIDTIEDVEIIDTNDSVTEIIDVDTEDDGKTVYEDVYKCQYILQDDNTYTYYDEQGQVIDENIEENTILQLLSTNSIHKID